MKLFLRVLKTDLQRTVASLRFILSVAGLSAVILLTLSNEFQGLIVGETPITYIRLLIGYWDFNIVYLLFAAIPGATIFCADWENRYVRFSAPRSSKKIYGISKAVSCFISAALTVTLSEWLNILILRFAFPAFNTEANYMDFGAYEMFAAPGLIYIHFAIEIMYKALCAGLLCVFALWVSTKITNVFVTLAAPLLLYYLINTVSMAFKIPSNLSIHSLSRGLVNINGSPAESIVYTVAIFLTATVVLSIAFVRSCRGRIENG